MLHPRRAAGQGLGLSPRTVGSHRGLQVTQSDLYFAQSSLAAARSTSTSEMIVSRMTRTHVLKEKNERAN